MKTSSILLLVLALFCSQAIAQQFVGDFYERRTQNEAFDFGLDDWQHDGQIDVIPWEQMPIDPDVASFEFTVPQNRQYLTEADDFFDAVDLGHVVKLTGSSSIWQYSPVNGKTDTQRIVCNARKRRIDGQAGPLGWTGFGVTYYDEDWNQIQTFEQQIFDVKLANFNFPNGYSQTGLGIQVPEAARHSVLWLANDGDNTELYADDFVLLNMFRGLPLVDESQPVGEQFTQDPANDNLVINSSLLAIIAFDDVLPLEQENRPGRFVICTDDSFWQKFGVVQDPIWGRFNFGTAAFSTGIGSYWQNIRLEPETEYELILRYNGEGQISFGVDQYDQGWQFLSNVNRATPFFNSRFNNEDRFVFRTVEGARNGSVWVWFGPENVDFTAFDISEVVLRKLN